MQNNLCFHFSKLSHFLYHRMCIAKLKIKGKSPRFWVIECSNGKKPTPKESHDVFTIFLCGWLLNYSYKWFLAYLPTFQSSSDQWMSVQILHHSTTLIPTFLLIHRLERVRRRRKKDSKNQRLAHIYIYVQLLFSKLLIALSLFLCFIFFLVCSFAG